MAGLKNLFGKGRGKDEEGGDEAQRKKSKLVSSYNLTYDQIKKQAEEAKASADEPAEEGEAHTADESVSVDVLARCDRFYREAAERAARR